MTDPHKLTQTAFRLPEGLLAWLHEQAAAEERPMKAIVTDALTAYKAASAPPRPAWRGVSAGLPQTLAPDWDQYQRGAGDSSAGNGVT